MKQNIKTEKKTINVRKIVRGFMKVLAHVAVFILAGYGLRHMFSVMQEGLSITLTVGIVAALAYIVFLDN